MKSQNANIIRFLEQSVQKNGSRLAIAEKNERHSFDVFYQSVIHTAAYYKSRGIGKGDRVLVLVPMSAGLYIQVIALFYLGAVAVFVDAWAGRSRIIEAVKIANCKAVLGGKKVYIWYLLNRTLRGTPVFLFINKTRNDTVGICQVATDAEALVTFTTGSTGKPKAANRTHGFLSAQYEILSHKLRLDDDDIEMTTLPIVLLCSLASGASSIIPDLDPVDLSSADPQKIIPQIRNEKVSRLIGSPHFISLIADHCIANNISLPSLKQIFSGGAPVFPDEASMWIKAFPSCQIEIIYGSTEAEPISSIDARKLAGANINKSGGLCVGKIHKATKLCILPASSMPYIFDSVASFTNAQLGKNDIGEIVVTGSHVLKAYINDPEAMKMNKITIGNETWHRTGDAGFIGADGMLYLVGRAKELFEFEGNLISPFLFEKKLSDVEGISSGTVMKLGGKTMTIVGSQLPENTVYTLLLEKGLGLGKIVILDALPKDPRHHSKIDYGKLRQDLSLSNVK